MSKDQERKPGFWDRLLGRGDQPAAEPDLPRDTPASQYEGAPDFTTAAADPLPAVSPTATSASPEVTPQAKFPPELAGADLQPVEGVDPQGGAPQGPTPVAMPDGGEATGGGWWRRLSQGMRRTSSSLGENVTGLFTKRRLDPAMLEELEDLLVRADLGLETAARVAAAVGEGRYNREIAPDEVRAVLAAEVEKTLAPVARPLTLDRAKKTLRDPGDRGERRRQDDDDRQARPKISRSGLERDDGGGRHVPGGRDRATEGLGRAHRRRRGRARAGLGPRGACLRRPARR
jgi:fused signal recognition particle receptor